MPKPRPKPTPAPAPKRPRRLWLNIGVAVLALAALVAVVVMSSMPNGTPMRTASAAPAKPAPVRTTPDADFARFAQLSARDLVAMSDAELEAMDPLVMNMVVAKGVPDLAGIDFAKYAKVVDGWAERIGAALVAREPGEAATSPAYQADPDIWRTGGMAMALAGSSIGIGYSRDVKLTNHADLFVPGLIDTKRGTCSNMPVLYMAVARRLGWPLKAVVAADHMWCRWDDGKKRFNLEATSSTSEGGMGSFATPPDESYRKDFKVSPKAEEVGSDLATLTARQTLGVYLQQRAGYYRESGKWADAEADLLMARLCFPQNRDILRNLLMVMDERAKGLYTPDEWARLVGPGEDPAVAQAKRKADQERLRQQLVEVERINRENQRQRERDRQPPR
ncbi:MAG: hypothetical protein IT436_09850 [Phycisphaerales bacterium]|nr:hypothetical protein [Phycisphaerales bacterium]